MRDRIFIAFVTFTVLGAASGTRAQVPSASPAEPRVRNVAAVGTPVGREQDVTLMLDQQNREQESGSNSLSKQNNLQVNQDRANQMVELLKTEEMQKALTKVTKRGKQALQEDPSLRTPLGVIAGAAGLWFGKSVKLFQGESFSVTTRLEARARSSEFSMESPLLNGRFQFNPDSGLNIYVNRKIASLDSQAEFNYSLQNQAFSTSIRKRITPNLDFTFGASQIPQTTTTDSNARIEYRFNF